MKKMQCVSLFAGCGGLDLGMRRAGMEIVFGTDLDERCAESHRLNFPRSNFHLGSITDLDAALLRKYLGRSLRTACDVLVGGPPCPPFSKSRFYRTEKPRALDDPLGHDSFKGYLRALEALRPRAFVLENVAGLAYDVHRDALRNLLQDAKRLGYATTWSVVNAADYGVPQIRERCIVVGVRGEQPFEFPKATHAKAPAGRAKAWRTAGEVLADLDTPENASDEGHFAGGKHHDLLRAVPPGQNYLFFTKERGHPDPKFRWRSRYWSFLLKLSPELPSWTIQARRSNNMGPFHWRNRILRIEEIKRLQTFPDEWALTGTIEQRWRQVGNAVPPMLAEKIGRALVAHLEDASA